MHTNRVLRNGVDTSKAAAAAVAQVRGGALRQAGAGGVTAAGIDMQKVSWLKRLLSRVFRRLFPLLQPALYRYREYTNRPILERLAQLQQRLDHIESYALAAARRVAVNCDDGRILVRSAVGYVLCSPSDAALLACLIETGELEIGTRLLIERLVRPGATFVDVGANIGLHTLAAARAMHGVGKVVAFEPYGPTHRLLAESVFINGLARIVELHQAAVSSQSGVHELYLGKTSGHHSLYALETCDALGSEAAEVRVVTLADVIPLETRIDCIKIDAEGAEIEVLKSAKPFIESNPDIALIVEFGPSHLVRAGLSVDDWFDQFAGMDLVYQAIDPIDGALSPCNPQVLAQLESTNLLFARRDSSVWEKTCERK